MKYNWKRFWCPRSGKFDLSDGGFLSDPEGEYAKWIKQDVMPFESISKYPCLVLLGEPGIGKSIAMKNILEESQKSVTDSGQNLLFINLNEYGDESRLIRDVFGCEIFNRWKNGSHILQLFIDSLDECRIRIPQVATILKNKLEQLGDILSRLRLRIACRTAEWPDTLEKYLPELWGEDNFGAFELVPLRRKDVRLACETENINPESFISELYRTECVPFAIKPVTLNFLFAIFKQESRFPDFRYDLYEKGCLLLCEEFNPNRQDLRMFGGVGHLTSEVRLNISSWIAAPNVVIVLIDDVGFGATTSFGGPIKTPTMDRLAKNGLRYNNFHTTALCSPTRMAIKTGRNHHTTNTGSIMETATAYPGNTGSLPQSVAPLAEMLRLNGYSTGAFGKWHETAAWETSVSGPFDRWPTHQGFDKFYGFIGGETDQWAPLIYDGLKKVNPPKMENYHFTTDMTNQAINWVKAQQSMTPDKPFFVYFACAKCSMLARLRSRDCY